MATAVASPAEHAQWEGTGTASSQRTRSAYSEQKRDRKRSPNRVKTKPANPTVINSILGSLGTLGRPASPPEDHESFSESVSERERPYSSSGTVRSLQVQTPSISPGFGVEYNNGLSMEDEDGVSEAALSPTVRTSRPPSGMSHYMAPRTPGFTGASPTAPNRTPSLRSRRSSYSSLTKEKTGYSKNKLSAESWVKQNPTGNESMENTDATRWSSRGLRRMNSQESFRRPGSRIDLVPEDVDAADSPVALSRAEQIIAKATTPPLSSSKRRLYLTDSASTEDHSVETPAPIDEADEVEESLGTPSPLPVEDETSAGKSSPRKSIIVDSIPMRTSSLRASHSSSPVRGKKKDRKSKRQAEKSEKADKKSKNGKSENSTSDEGPANGKVDSVIGPAAKRIPESSWADLGEEDETVRRIRQLQEQRKSRLMDSHTFVVPQTANAATNQIPVMSDLTPARDGEQESKHASRPRPNTNRAVTEPPVKAHKALGITAENARIPPSPSRGMDVVINGMADSTQRRNLSLDEKKLQLRPITSSENTPPLSLDYSYAEAVDALHGAEREPVKESKVKALRTGEPSARSVSEQITRVSAQYPGTQVKLVPTEASPSLDTTPNRLTKSQRRKQQDRWTQYHPDLPLDFDKKKKDRRKSTSDARNNPRNADSDAVQMPPVPRRDSIEMAVTEYLNHARLSRRIRHPVTGRVISFSEVGNSNGAAVFICVGMGLTRYVTAFYDELATTLRLRLITVDRPGVGASEPYPPMDRSGPLNWAEDVTAICNHLEITEFSMLAHSAGAIYALATALVMPHAIHGKIHLLAPWIPPSQLGAVSHSTASAPPAAALPRSQRILRVLPTTFLKAANSSFMTATSASLKPATKRTRSRGHNDLPTPSSRGRDRPATRDGAAPSAEFNRRESMMLMDQFMPDLNEMEHFAAGNNNDHPEDGDTSPSREIPLTMSATAGPMDPSSALASTALYAAEHTEKERKTAFTTALTQRTWELAVRDSNPATDLLVCLERHREVGFRYTDVKCAVVVTHGSEDKRVPVGNVRWLTEQMNRRSVLPPLPGSRGGSSGGEWGGVGGCELRVLPGEGHGLMASPGIMGDVLTEIAGYWKGR